MLFICNISNYFCKKTFFFISVTNKERLFLQWCFLVSYALGAPRWLNGIRSSLLAQETGCDPRVAKLTRVAIDAQSMHP